MKGLTVKLFNCEYADQIIMLYALSNTINIYFEYIEIKKVIYFNTLGDPLHYTFMNNETGY